MKAKNPQKKKGLVGHWFHSIGSDNQVEWQGVVIENPEPGWYLVQAFDWLAGAPSCQYLVQISDMSKWLFYDNSEQLNYSYEHGCARLGGTHRKPTNDTPLTIEELDKRRWKPTIQTNNAEQS